MTFYPVNRSRDRISQPFANECSVLPRLSLGIAWRVPGNCCLNRNLQQKDSSMSSGFRTAFLQAALEEARTGLREGGIPIGAVLVIDDEIVGRGHNRRIQKGSAILHAEMDAIENAGRLRADDYRRAVLYSTLSPCDMCSGAVLLYRIPRIVIGEHRSFRGPEEYLRSRGVMLEDADDPECQRLMAEFIRSKPELWNEDIGE